MNTPETQASGNSAFELPPFSLGVQALDLGGEVKAVGLELVETENREPVRGKEGAEMWSAILPALAGNEPYVVDFFSHVARVREFCKMQQIEWREAAERCVALPQPSQEQLRQIFERFEGETFGMRTGAAAQTADAALEADLSKRGLDAYQAAYARYTFCAICEPEDGWVTLLSETLWPSEIIRRLRPAVQRFDVHIARPN
jgi:predicted secreted protein